MLRPITTLFMLMSVDGKISTGVGDSLDFDTDLSKVESVAKGLHQYYDIEQTTDSWSMVTGKTMAKIGANVNALPNKTNVNFVVVDSDNLTERGIRYMSAKANSMLLLTTNNEHPAFSLCLDNVRIILRSQYNLKYDLQYLYNIGCRRLTLQTGGNVNGVLLRDKLIDFVDIVIAPILVGGSDTPTLIDGESIISINDLNKLGYLRLESCERLDGSYVRLRYSVI